MPNFPATYIDQLAADPNSEYRCQQALKNLLTDQLPAFQVDFNPRRGTIGAPDFIIWDGAKPVGYLFAYPLGTSLESVENSRRFAIQNAALPNIILTNYLEFHGYSQSHKQQTVTLGRFVDQHIQADRNPGNLNGLLQGFSQYQAPTIEHAEPLSEQLGQIARELRYLLSAAMTEEPIDRELLSQMQVFRDLVPDLTPDTFADMYAQTFISALFVARVRHQGAARQKAFNRRDVYWDLPPTNPFMRDLFQAINNAPLDERVAWLVDALAALLTQTDIESVLRDFGRRTHPEDPLGQFYENFFRHYTGEENRARGIAYTPEPVVSYILRSVNQLLRKRFDQALGLASPKALIVDPAAGSGTFLYLITQQIYDILRQQHQLGAWDTYARDDLLPRIIGLDIGLAPYAITHMKLAIQLRRLGYSFASNQRLRVYLSNALDCDPATTNEHAFAQLLQTEMQQGCLPVGDYPMLVMVGNPPQRQYAANSPRPGFDDLEQDYARFLRLGQQLMTQHKSGILAFVTPNDFLTDPDYSTLRQQLLGTFRDAYFLNLHGQNGEKAPDNITDENLFDTDHGLVVSIFVRRDTHHDDNRVYYADTWGTQADKSNWLLEHDVYDSEWQRINPQAPDYLFIPQVLHVSSGSEPETGWKLTDIFPVSLNGIAADADQLRYTDAGAHEVAQRRHIPSSHVLYRPFDSRYVICTEEQARSADIVHMTQANNLALCIQQTHLSDYEGGHMFCVNLPIHQQFMLGNPLQFPLYLLPDAQTPLRDSAFPPGKDGRSPNLNHEFILLMANKLHMTFIPQGRGDLKYTFGPEDIFDYIYALFHSMIYRARPFDALPYIPLPNDKKHFRVLAKKGQRLASLHLLRKADSRSLLTGFNGTGGNEVTDNHPSFIELAGEPGGRIYINNTKFFDVVDRRVWKYQVGGYQVLHEWLNQRLGEVLDWQAIYYYQQVIETIRQTFRVMDEIDEITANRSSR